MKRGGTSVTTSRRPSGRRLAARWALVLAALGILGGAVWFLLTHTGPSAPASQQGSGVVPDSPYFAFSLARVQAVPVGGVAGSASAHEAGAGVQKTLSKFYGAAFVDPSSWSGHVADGAWNAFAESLRSRALTDAPSLTIGKIDATAARLRVTNSNLSIRLLLDPSGRPQSAIASVAFQATGVLESGERFGISNQAHFLLQPFDGTWLIVGYPNVHTEISAPSAVPSAVASGAAATSPGAGSSPGATP